MTVPGLALGYRVFRLPRQGYVLEECQDASAGDPERGRFAIADGAAESPYSALWARLLVEEFVRQSERLPRWANWLPSLQERWAAAGEPANGRRRLADGTGDAGVPWYLEPGLIQGAFATFLGVVIEETNWHALAVGDSCLFQVRAGRTCALRFRSPAPPISATRPGWSARALRRARCRTRTASSSRATGSRAIASG